MKKMLYAILLSLILAGSALAVEEPLVRNLGGKTQRTIRKLIALPKRIITLL